MILRKKTLAFEQPVDESSSATPSTQPVFRVIFLAFFDFDSATLWERTDDGRTNSCRKWRGRTRRVVGIQILLLLLLQMRNNSGAFLNENANRYSPTLENAI